MVEARSVNVKNTTTSTTYRPHSCCYFAFLAFLGRAFFFTSFVEWCLLFTQVCPILLMYVQLWWVVYDVCCLYLCRFAGLRGVSATPTSQISWHKTASARFRLLCHPLCTKSNKHMLTPAYAFVNAEKAHLCRSPCEHYGPGPKKRRLLCQHNEAYSTV